MVQAWESGGDQPIVTPESQALVSKRRINWHAGL
jgi:hypothetical protein